MKIVCTSDTHGKHKQLNLPEGDLLIHGGDFSSYGYKHEVESFFNWLKKSAKQFELGVVFIAGNHDRSFDPKYFRQYEDHDLFKNHAEEPGKPFWLQRMIEELPTNIHYLENSSVEIEGVKIWGSPVTPWFYGDTWAFNRRRGFDISEVWDQIPFDTDIIVTHGPVHSRLDRCMDGSIVGCEDLERKVDAMKPKVHIAGHIHEGYGISYNEDTTFINASFCDARYIPRQAPIVFEI